LQRLALQTRAWFSVVTAGLAGNAVSGIVPGGAAVRAGLASYWLPLCAGLPDYLLYRHRYGRLAHQSRH
jgi:hypothetical protein